MAGQVRDGLKQDRAAVLEHVARAARRRYLESLVGLPVAVLVESPVADRPGWMQGTAERYVPVRLPGGRELIGQMVTAVPDSNIDQQLEATSQEPVRFARPLAARCYTQLRPVPTRRVV